MTVRADDWQPTLDDPEVQQYIFEEVGEEGLELALYLEKNQPVSGVQILEDHGDRKPSDVRKVLYRMMEAHVAEYDKDTDAKGWETFHWTLDLNEVKYILRRRWADELTNLRKQVRFEKDHQFYACPDRHRRIVFEDAMEMEFTCPVCRQPMDVLEDKEIAVQLQDRIDELEPFFKA